MRSRTRKKQDVWVAAKTQVEEGISLVDVYGVPEMHRATVSLTSGTPHGWGFGFLADYDRYMTTHEKDWMPVEGSAVWVDVSPVLDSNGELVTEVNDEGDTVYVSPPDYIVKRLNYSQKSPITKVWLKKLGD